MQLTQRQRDKLVEDHLSLVKFVAQKIARRLPPNVELDDLVSSGSEGLLDASRKYDPSRDNTFKTYAEIRISGAMFDGLRIEDWGATLYSR